MHSPNLGQDYRYETALVRASARRLGRSLMALLHRSERRTKRVVVEGSLADELTPEGFELLEAFYADDEEDTEGPRGTYVIISDK